VSESLHTSICIFANLLQHLFGAAKNDPEGILTNLKLRKLVHIMKKSFCNSHRHIVNNLRTNIVLHELKLV
jgi:hypothetical protein